MSAGGFIFAKTNLAYDANTNGLTIRDWALAVHKARCQAFLDAATREQQTGGQGWYSVQTMINDEMNEYIGGAYYSGTVYIQDIHPLSVDASGEYPAFVSFMKANSSGAEYCIITARNYHCNPNNSDRLTNYTYGLYMYKENLCLNGGTIQFGQCMGHAFASNGFGNYDVSSSSFLTYGCTKIIGSFVQHKWNNFNYTDNSSSDSLIVRRVSSQTDSRLVDKTYTFGYAIKGDQIEVFYRRTDAVIWLWSVIGNILDILISNGDESRVCALSNSFLNNSETTFDYTSIDVSTTPDKCYVSFTKSDGNVYTPSTYNIYTDFSRTVQTSTSIRTATSAPTDTRYNGISVFAFNNSDTTNSDQGIDGNGNGCKGFVSTDVLRMVSASACPTSGVTFQNGNFVSIKSSPEYSIGFILGWDSSNESII